MADASGVLGGAASGAAAGSVAGPWGALAGGVIGGVSSLLSQGASNKAAQQQQAASHAAQQLQGQQYNQARTDLSPYTSAGGNAANLLTQGLGDGTNGDLTRRFGLSDFQTDPGYQFRMDQGANAVQGSAAARGGVLSGAAQKALAQYGQGFASKEYQDAYIRYNTDQNNRYQRISGTANMGAQAANTLAGVDQNYGNSMSNLLTGAGNSAAAGTISADNQRAGMVNQGLNYAGQAYNLLTKPGFTGGNIAPFTGGGSAGTWGTGEF